MAYVVIGEGTGEFRGKSSFRGEFVVLDTKTGETIKILETMKVSSRTKAEKKRCLRELREKIENSTRYDARSMTVRQLCDEWMGYRAQDGEVAVGTLRKDKSLVDNICLHLGAMHVTEVRPYDIKDMLSKLAAGETVSGRPASGTRRADIFVKANQVFEDAVINDIIAKNPCRGVKRPKNDTQERSFLSFEQVRLMLVLAEALPVGTPSIGFYLALLAGLRRGEICALRWKNVDFDKGIIHVENSYSSDTLSLEKPKGGRERRLFAPSFLMAMLKEWKERQARILRLTLGIEQGPDTPVVSSQKGGFMHPDNLRRSWGRFAARHGMGAYTLHELRHTYATILFALNADLKAVQNNMGHLRMATTMEIYVHYVEAKGEEAAGALDALAKGLGSGSSFGEAAPTVLPGGSPGDGIALLKKAV